MSQAAPNPFRYHGVSFHGGPRDGYWLPLGEFATWETFVCPDGSLYRRAPWDMSFGQAVYAGRYDPFPNEAMREHATGAKQ